MKDFNIGKIKPAGDHRIADKPVRKEKGTVSSFDLEVQSALSKTKEVVARFSTLPAGKVDSGSIQERLKTETEDFNKLMEAKMEFQKLFRDINSKKS